MRTWEERNQVRGTLETAEGGHAKCFGVEVLEIIEASEGIVCGTKGCSINKVGALGMFKKLAQGDLVVEQVLRTESATSHIQRIPSPSPPKPTPKLKYSHVVESTL